MRRVLAFVAAAAPWLWLIVFCNLQSGIYTGTCDGEPVVYTVGADGTLGVECQSVSVVRTTEGGSVTCKERAR
ncbi:hypothetical protein KAW64_12915 [bacterium]|nr:hypothetical protein [bacterium]